MSNISGILKSVELTPYNNFDPRWPNISGTVIKDFKNRFVEGDRIYSSRVENIYRDEGGTWFVKTHYSLYQVEFKPGTNIIESLIERIKNLEN